MWKVFFLILLSGSLFAQQNNLRENYTPGYDEAIIRYQNLADKYSSAHMLNAGPSDSGKPIWLFVISSDNAFTPAEAIAKGKLVILVNNGIHAGEPCGVNASILFAENLLAEGPDPDVVFLIIPVYNVGGSLNRGCCSRANQAGPEEYGFRGNARLLDLNRDFIKADSKNTLTFISIFRSWDPHIFIDTHSTNGADYQYNMTLISTQADKLGGSQGTFLRDDFEPELYSAMAKKNNKMIPYVNVFKTIPDSGFSAFLETPRYATGYTALFQCLGFVTEAHMLKPFPVRVQATLDFLNALYDLALAKKSQILLQRDLARKQLLETRELPLNYQVDKSRMTMIPFDGFSAGYRTSEVTGKEVLFYNQKKPFSKSVPYLRFYTPTDIVELPEYYLVPGAWNEVIDRLKNNQVRMTRVQSDTSFRVEVGYIESYETVPGPYEGHYLHYNTTLKRQTDKITARTGDYLIPTKQLAKRFVVETLEPVAADSYFNWNFYDEILQQKEWFSSYVFDTTASRLIKEQPGLKQRFDSAAVENPDWTHDEALYFIYRNSPYFEKSFRRYPVFRVVGRN